MEQFLAFLFAAWCALLLLAVAVMVTYTPRTVEQKTEQRDYTGMLIGYKFVVRRGGRYYSPNGAPWDGLTLTANVEPTADNTSGIYATRASNDPALDEYRVRVIGGKCVLVKLALSGVVAHHESGYRAQHAEIILPVLEEY